MKTETDVYSRLGAPEQVANAAAVAYRRRSFIGRHPAAAFFAFAVSPVVSLILLFYVMCVVTGILGMAAEYCGLVSNEGFSGEPLEPVILLITSYVFSLLLIIIPVLITSILFCKLSKRLGVGRKWMCVSCSTLALTALLPCLAVKTTIIDATGHYGVQIGMGILGIFGSWMPSFVQVAQALIPLAIGGWFFWRYAGKPNRVSITAT